MSRAVLTGWLAVAFLTVPGAGHAELFRCVGPDGKTIFTDQKHMCPGSEPSEPSGVVHRAPTPESREAAPVSPLASPGTQISDDAVDASAEWKQKKTVAEQKVAQIQARHEWLKGYVSYCNRGAYITTRDDAGIQQVVNCSELRREFHDLEQQEAAAREYLATGLPEECRRAGCLPGWLR